ncbi:MAG: tetratricopeptide repeat protein [Acidobacteriota bacterium]
MVLLLAQADELALKSRRATELMAAGRYGEAIPLYTELIRAVPNNPGLILNLGLAQQMAGRPRESIPQFEAAVKLQPDLYPAWFSLGTAYLDLGEPARASAPLEKAAALEPRDPRAILALGRCYEALAQRAFERLDKLGQGSAWWLALAAETRLSQQQYASAFGLYREALAKMPALPGAHAALAEIYRKTGHPDWAAIEEKKEPGRKAARAGQPPTPESYYWQSRAYSALAAQTFARLAQLPPSVELHQFRAQLARSRRRYPEAAAELREALKLAPGDRQLRTELAAALHQARDHQGAQAILAELLKADPQAAQLNFMYGDTLLRQEQPEKAIPFLEKAVRLTGAQASLGLAYMRTGQPERAIPHLKAALETDTDGSLHYQLARACQMTGQPEAAAPLLKKYQEIQRRAEPAEAQITPP